MTKGNSDHGTTYRRVGGDDGELRPWHFICDLKETQRGWGEEDPGADLEDVLDHSQRSTPRVPKVQVKQLPGWGEEKRFRGGHACKAHRRVYHSTLTHR